MQYPLARRRLTVALVVRSAETLLRSTLESIREIADELIVLDTGSSDRTVDVAKSCGASVLQSPWADNFASARNHAWDHVTGDWILWLDAGESISPDSAAALRHFVDTEADFSKAYMMIVEVPPVVGEISGQQVGRIRLVPNYSSLRFTGRVREDLLAGMDRAGLALEGLPWRIQRTEHDLDPAVRRERAERDLALAQLEMTEHGESPAMLNAAGESFVYLGQYTQACEAFRRSLQLAEHGSIPMLQAYYGLLTSLDSTTSGVHAHVDLCLEALTVFPCDAQLLCAMGSYQQALGNVQLAAQSYVTAVNHGQIRPELWHLTDIAEVAAVCAGKSLQLTGDLEQAQSMLEVALETQCSSERLRRQLIDTYIRRGQRQKALEQVSILLPDASGREHVRTAVRGACFASDQQWTQAVSYLEIAHSAGCRDPIVFKWLAMSYYAVREDSKATAIARQWLSYEPLNEEAKSYLTSISEHSRREAA